MTTSQETCKKRNKKFNKAGNTQNMKQMSTKKTLQNSSAVKNSKNRIGESQHKAWVEYIKDRNITPEQTPDEFLCTGMEPMK